MQNIYLTDSNRVYVEAREFDPYGAIPAGSSFVAPPATAAGEFAQLSGGAWRVLSEYPVPPPVVPAAVTPAQGLVALYALKGITEDDLHATINQISDPVQQYTARIGVTRTTEWLRASETTQGMAALLSLTDADMDALFVYASGVDI